MGRERPLAGRRVAVTRPPDRAGDLAEALGTLGADVLEAPAIEVVAPADPAPLDAALGRLGRYAWVVFTSVNAVRFVLERMAQASVPAAALGSPRIAAVGRATAAALVEAGVAVDLVPEDESADGLVAELEAGRLAQGPLLIPRAAKGRQAFIEAARARGLEVDVVEAYRTRRRPGAGVRVREALEAGRLDAVAFASPSQVQAVLEGMGEAAGRLREVVCVAIGRTTAAALEAADVPAVVADRADPESMAEALARAFEGSEGSRPG